MYIVVAQINGTTTRFCIEDPEDLIQKHHYAGDFFEKEELAVINERLGTGAVFVDIGANIGNHSLFVALFTQARKIIPFEPNPPAIRLLVSNIALNDVDAKFDTLHLGLGLSASEESGFQIGTADGNLGRTQLLRRENGALEVITGDAALAREERIDMIKIDVEGMEMQVLAGLTKTLKRLAPQILIEIDHENRSEFDTWLAKANYRIDITFPRQTGVQNFLIKPVSAP
ncbi:MAG: FkbM family methyltransferase [Pseudomonadota bacterium]